MKTIYWVEPTFTFISDDHINIEIDAKLITKVKEAKSVGVIIDEHLSWSNHIDLLSNKFFYYIYISCSEAAKMIKKCAVFKLNKISPSMRCVTEHVTSNSGKQSDSFHSTSENSENLNR